ncbi:N-acetyltransferase [Mycetocola manganoxydans]|uniref:N-acetyltransferase n=1 Tax=Mycetocola manganoxydans TaxID=699879 RepID=A0A3L6ZWG1_9MICO|nr:N-acetyltransferase [Mycetocola manganoxydans]GHD40795.1 hypothetical protein GCM10008097_05290 [Mycetocola manganoxydans]
MGAEQEKEEGTTVGIRATVGLEPWGPRDFPVLERSNTPAMTVYLGGPESAEKLATRHAKYLRLVESGEAAMFTVHVDSMADAVGSVGYWQTVWRDAPVYECGWSIATPHQGRGYASAALAACVDHAVDHGDRDLLVAFPRTDNAASNALCRAGGFELSGVEDAEYPPGNPIRVHAWVLDLAERRSNHRHPG